MKTTEVTVSALPALSPSSAVSLSTVSHEEVSTPQLNELENSTPPAKPKRNIILCFSGSYEHQSWIVCGY